MEQLSLSVVVEWENVQTSADTRAEKMLGALRSQIASTSAPIIKPVEILLVYPIDGTSPPPTGLPDDRESSVTFVGTQGLDYYSQKNHGASLAKGDLLLFVDSDVVPDEGWLDALLRCFLDNSPCVVGGETYLDVGNRYDHAVSSFWIFPRKGALAPHADVRRALGFFANNVLFARDEFLKLPFPDTRVIRGRCRDLGDAIIARGGIILRASSARVSHPAPNGLRHFLKRAMSDGHDAAVARRSRRPAALARRYARTALHDARKVWREAERSDYGLGSRLCMSALPVAYHLAAFGGEVSAWLAPHWTRERVRV